MCELLSIYCNVESIKSTWEVHGIIHRDRVKISDRPPKRPKPSIQTNAKKRDGSIHSASEGPVRPPRLRSAPHPQSEEPTVHHVKAVAILSPVRDAPLLLADLRLAASVLHEHLAAHSLRKRRQSGLLRLWQAHRWIDARQHARDDLRRQSITPRQKLRSRKATRCRMLDGHQSASGGQSSIGPQVAVTG